MIGTTVAPLESLGSWKWLLPLGVLMMTAIHIQEQWLTRARAFTTQSRSLVVGNASNSGSKSLRGLRLEGRRSRSWRVLVLSVPSYSSPLLQTW